METVLETMSDLERRLTIRLPMEPIEREYAARVRALELRSVQQGVYIHLRDQLMQGVRHSGFLEAVSQHGLSTFGTPVFSAAAEENGMLVFSVDFAVLPEIDTGSYGDIRITRPVGKVSEQDVDGAIPAQHGNIDNDDKKLRAAVREKLEYQLARAVRQAIKPQLMEALLARHSFTPPETMVAREFEKRMAGWRQRQAGNPMVRIPAEDQVRTNSRRAVCLGIIFTGIIQSAKILRDDARIHQEIEYIASKQNNPAEVIDRYHQDEAMLAQVEETVRIDKAIDWVVGKADVVDVPSSFAQIVGDIR